MKNLKRMTKRLLAITLGCVVGAALLYAHLAPLPESYATVLPYCEKTTAQPQVAARAAYAYDAATGVVLYEKNSNTQLPLASLTKVMTVVTALDMLTPTTTVTITSDALRPEGEYGLTAGERWRVSDLADFTLVASANDGARALMLAAAEARGIRHEQFFAAMNQRARTLGLTETYFMNETGLDLSASTAGAYGSAHDIAVLFSYVALEYPDVVGRSVVPRGTFVSLSGTEHPVQNTSLLASSLLASSLSKTGYTDLAGGNLAVVFEPVLGHPVAVAVLGSTREGRDADAAAVARYAAVELRRLTLCASL